MSVMTPPLSSYTLRLRRYDPESGREPYWQELEVALEGHRSVLDAILQVRNDVDGSIGVRCSCRAAMMDPIEHRRPRYELSLYISVL